MKYKFQVIVCLTYEDEIIDTEVELTDEEVAQIKELVAEYKESHKQPSSEEDFEPETSLLSILEEKAPDLYEKLWDVIFERVFVELLIDGMKNYGTEMRHDDDPVDDPEEYRSMPFDRLYEMYGDDIEIEHSCCCICRIPEDW